MPEDGSAGRRPEPIVAAFERLSGSVSTLVRDHLELAKLELRDGLRSATHDAITIGAGVAILVVGYGLLMTGLALGLAQWMPAWAALVVVGAVNLGAGSAVIHQRVKLIRARQLPEVLPVAAVDAPR